jgi:hypothetical protein
MISIAAPFISDLDDGGTITRRGADGMRDLCRQKGPAV